MNKFIKNMLIVSAITSLSTSTVYGYSNVELNEVELNEIKHINLTDALKKNTNTTENNNITQNTNTNNTVRLNTNVNDIKAMSFYNTTLSSDENAVNIADTMFKDVAFTQLEKPKKGDVVAVIETSEGTIKVKLLPEVAPKAVKNFVEHSLDGYYDGLTFHRVIDGFVAQGGDPTGTGRGGESVWGKSFVNEVNPSARHFSGALAMANSGGTATNGSQFYFVDNVKLSKDMIEEINYIEENQDMILEHMHPPIIGEENVYHEGDVLLKDMYPSEVMNNYKTLGGTPNLDFGYTVFGQTYEGLDVIDKITQVSVDLYDKPMQPVVIEKVTIGIVE